MTSRILGVHESAPSGHRFPGAPWGREFVSNSGSTLPEGTTAEALVEAVHRKLRPHREAGGNAIVSVKLPLESVMRGRWDSRLEALGSSLAATDELIINHEPENSHSARVFVDGFNRAAACIRRGGGQQAPKVSYAAMAYQWRPRSATTSRPARWLADLATDRWLIDAYLGRTFAQELAIYEHPGVRRFLDSLPDDALWGFAEYGRLKHPQHSRRAEMIRLDMEWLASGDERAQRCRSLIVWNTSGTEDERGWLLDPLSERAVREGLEVLSEQQ